MKRILLIAACTACALSPAKAQADYVADNTGQTTSGVWTEVGATKILPYNLTLGLDAGLRTSEWFDEASRFDIGLGLGWKPTKHWKFGVSYTFIMKHYPLETAQKTEYKYRPAGESENTDFASFLGAPAYSDGTTSYTYKGKNISYRTTDAFWRPKHRISIDGTYTYKLWRWLRLSLRERYQLTLMPSKTVGREKVLDKYRGVSYTQASVTSESDVTYDEITRYWQDGETIYALDLTDASATARDVTSTYQAEHDDLNTDKEKSSKTIHTLRSRFTLEVDKKGWQWAPYAYVELFNNMGDGFHTDKFRTSVGVEYSVSSLHRLQLGYVFNHENDDDGDQNIHAIAIGYKVKF